MRRLAQYLCVLALLTPLLFINIRSSHDWGDDFAQYIHQAKNISQGISQNETGYIFNPEVAVIGPKAYPSGFPLLLAPLVKHGTNYALLDRYLSAFLLASCFIGFLLLRRSFSFATALFTTLIIAYNPVTLSFKAEILSDIPFMFFSLLALYLALQKESILLSIIIGALAGFTCHIRSMGLVLLISLVITSVMPLRKKRAFSFSEAKYLLCMLLAFVAVYAGIKLGWPADSSYPYLFETWEPYTSAVNHLSYQNAALHNFFKDYEIKDYYFIGFMAASCLTCFCWIGFIYRLKTRRFDLITIYTGLYIVALLVYKFSDSGLRFIFPLLFLLFYFAITGLSKATNALSPRKGWMPYVFGGFVLFSYHGEIEKLMDHQQDVLEGPCTPAAQEAFAWIDAHVPSQAVIASDKPRLLALYTGRPGVCLKDPATPSELAHQLTLFKAGYCFTHSLLTAPARQQVLSSDSLHYQPVFDNGTCKIYKVKINP